jgi:glycosyltransferase involved in cell wall biosynthesis
MPVEVSVVIPTFRRPRELKDAITSVLRQWNVSLEVLVVDDSPEGGARETVASIADARVSYLQNPQPTGGIPSIVRNLGIAACQGRLVHFLDDDDLVPEGHYAAVKQAFLAQPNAGVVFGIIEPFGSGPREQLQHECMYFADAAKRAAAAQRLGHRWGFVGNMLFAPALLVCSSSVSRLECVREISGFDPHIRLMEDADFHLRMFRRFGAHFMNSTSLHYRVGSPSLMHSPNPNSEQRHEELIGRRKMQAKYRAEHGAMEFYALALLTRTAQKLF